MKNLQVNVSKLEGKLDGIEHTLNSQDDQSPFTQVGVQNNTMSLQTNMNNMNNCLHSKPEDSSSKDVVENLSKPRKLTDELPSNPAAASNSENMADAMAEETNSWHLGTKSPLALKKRLITKHHSMQKEGLS